MSRQRGLSVDRNKMVAALLRAAGLVCLLLPLGCQQRMAMQPSYKPLDPSDFFQDGRSARPLVPGTVARGYLRTDVEFFLGRRNRGTPAAAAAVVGNIGNPLGAAAVQVAAEANRYADNVDTFPFPVTREVMQEGRNRYMIYCVVCHDPAGTGEGKIVERGYTEPPSYHIDRLRRAPVGHFFQVMTEGYGSMPDYRQQLTPRQRWAVAAYIRALQLSQHFPEHDLTPAMRSEWQKQDAASGGKAP